MKCWHLNGSPPPSPTDVLLKLIRMFACHSSSQLWTRDKNNLLSFVHSSVRTMIIHFAGFFAKQMGCLLTAMISSSYQIQKCYLNKCVSFEDRLCNSHPPS